MVGHRLLRFVILLLLVLLSSCARYPEKPLHRNTLAYTVEEEDQLLHRFAPVFLIEEAEKDFNRIGTPKASLSAGREDITVDPDEPAIYTSVRNFSTERGEYTNLIYRVHFPKVPLSFVPFYLGAGKNVGLLVFVTLDNKRKPLLYTLVHTCGCYLGFVVTSNLPRHMWKKGWSEARQVVFGENLPAFLHIDEKSKKKLAIQIRTDSHRVKNLYFLSASELAAYQIQRTALRPFLTLDYLQLPDGRLTSFYEQSGPRRGYVKGSGKIWERILMGWWALDWRVGEDKKLGRDTSDGIVFYTSLKPWAREESDLRDFTRFLEYWGWRL